LETVGFRVCEVDFAEFWQVIPTNTGGQGTLAMLVQALDSPLLTGLQQHTLSIAIMGS
jgi:hypothetical protein